MAETPKDEITEFADEMLRTALSRNIQLVGAVLMVLDKDGNLQSHAANRLPGGMFEEALRQMAADAEPWNPNDRVEPKVH